MHVRIATLADMPALMGIEERCFGVERFSPETVTAFVVRRDAFVVLAEEGTEAVGSAMCILSQGEGRVASVAVLPEHRNKGIGGRLLNQCEKVFLRHRLYRYSLEVDVENDPAIALYTSKGYEINGMIQNFYGPGRDAYMMVKSPRTAKKVRVPIS